MDNELQYVVTPQEMKEGNFKTLEDIKEDFGRKE